MGGDLLPDIWLRLGHTGTRRTFVCFIYREHKPWKSRDDSVRGQEERLNIWLEARKPVWGGQWRHTSLGTLILNGRGREIQPTETLGC